MTGPARQLCALVLLCIVGTASAGAGQAFPGDRLLALTSTEFEKATIGELKQRTEALLTHLDVPSEARRSYLSIFDLPAGADKVARFDKKAGQRSFRELNGFVILASHDVVISFGQDLVVVAGGNVKIAHAENVLVVARGSIEISHDGNNGTGRSLFVTRQDIDISHGSRSSVYAVGGATFSHPAQIVAYNTDVRAGYGVVSKLSRDPIFMDEPVRTRVPDRMTIDTSAGFAYTGKRCERTVLEEHVAAYILPDARRSLGCLRVDAVRVRCVEEPRAGAPRSGRSIERWTVQLCGQEALMTSGSRAAPRSWGLPKRRLARRSRDPRPKPRPGCALCSSKSKRSERAIASAR